MGILLEQRCMCVHNGNPNTFNFNGSCYARKVLWMQAQQRNKFAIVWKHTGYADFRGSRILMSSVNCILIRQWLTDDVTDRILVWKVFLWAFLSNLKKINRKIIIKYVVHVDLFYWTHKWWSGYSKSIQVIMHLHCIGPLSKPRRPIAYTMAWWDASSRTPLYT